jgi:hypothetical protein
MEYDLLLYNGNFVRFAQNRNYNWLLIKGSIIVDAGFGKETDKYKNNCLMCIDLNEKTVLPGFYDSHVHFIQTALHMENLDLNGSKDYYEIEKRIEDWISKYPQTKFIYCYGLEITDLLEENWPTRKFLDNISKEHSIIINSRDFHNSILNTKAINMFKAPLTIEGVERDEQGYPNGIFNGMANALIRKRILKSCRTQDRIGYVKNLAGCIIKKGVTSIHAVEGGFDFCDKDAELLHSYVKEIPIDISLYYSTTDISKIKSSGLNRIGGDIYIDGSFTSMSAAISFNYRNTNMNGNLYFSQDDINEFILECYKNNLDTALHAVGDRAVDQVLNAHIFAQNVLPNNKLRHRIEHVELTSSEQKHKAKELGIIFSMQPAFEYYYGGNNGMYENRLNSHYKETNEFRKIFDEGIIICGGSDSDLTPIDPILGIHAAVNHPVQENSISVEEAIKMFTINAAYAVREENKKGSIDIGKLADLVILDKDIYKINKKSIITTQVLGTIKNGKFLYKNF